MRWIAGMPWRKPMAVFSVLMTFAVIARAFWAGEDIPAGIVSVLNFLNGFTVGGYFGSSAYEAAHAQGSPSAPQAPRQEFPPLPHEQEGDAV